MRRPRPTRAVEPSKKTVGKGTQCLKVTVPWNVKPCSLVDKYQYSSLLIEAACLKEVLQRSCEKPLPSQSQLHKTAQPFPPPPGRFLWYFMLGIFTKISRYNSTSAKIGTIIKKSLHENVRTLTIIIIRHDVWSL